MLLILIGILLALDKKWVGLGAYCIITPLAVLAPIPAGILAWGVTTYFAFKT